MTFKLPAALFEYCFYVRLELVQLGTDNALFFQRNWLEPVVGNEGKHSRFATEPHDLRNSQVDLINAACDFFVKSGSKIQKPALNRNSPGFEKSFYGPTDLDPYRDECAKTVKFNLCILLQRVWRSLNPVLLHAFQERVARPHPSFPEICPAAFSHGATELRTEENLRLGK
ncbi:MAG: hypothetical protein WAM01_00580 [Candidatus Acidiferrales bacterium]